MYKIPRSVLVVIHTGAFEVLLLERAPWPGYWQSVTGSVATADEPLGETAVREVREETGYDVVLGRPLGAQRYEAFGAPKTAHFWAGRALGGRFGPNHEVDRMAWLPVPDAADLVTADRDRRVLARFADGPIDTVPLVLLRHARAVARHKWPAPDAQRPLDPAGQEQASGLAAAVAAYGPMRVVSSDSRRCLESVAPLAERWRTPVCPEPALTEEAFRSAPEAALALVRGLLAAGEPALVCTHRPLLAALLASVLAGVTGPAGHPGTGHPGTAPPTALTPGGFWVLHLYGGQLAAVETHST